MMILHNGKQTTVREFSRIHSMKVVGKNNYYSTPSPVSSDVAECGKCRSGNVLVIGYVAQQTRNHGVFADNFPVRALILANG